MKLPRTLVPDAICLRASANTVSPADRPFTICTRVPSEKPSVTSTAATVSPSTFWTMRLPPRVAIAVFGTSSAFGVVASMIRALAYMPASIARPAFGTRTSIMKCRLRSSTSGEIAASCPLNVWPGLACTATMAFIPVRSRPASSSETPASSFISLRSTTTTIGLSPGMAPLS